MSKQSTKVPNFTLPTKVNVLGRDIKVVRGVMKDEEFGEYSQHRYVITINNKLDKVSALQTLFHEIIHASLHISGITQMIPADSDGGEDDHGPDLEEAIVVCLENALSKAIDINKFTVK